LLTASAARRPRLQPDRYKRRCARPVLITLNRHCEERSDEAIE